jgi:hypothetical protein
MYGLRCFCFTDSNALSLTVNRGSGHYRANECAFKKTFCDILVTEAHFPSRNAAVAHPAAQYAVSGVGHQ